jgi:murein DD-endopeptidase MepM/ murein hydrolase activator NlpD
MTGDRWTFVVARGDEGPAHQFSLSPKVLLYGGGAGLAIGLLVLVVALGSVFGGVTRLQARQLEARNEALTHELARLQDQVGGLEGTLDRLASRDAQLRALAGLDPLDGDVLQVGVGGPGLLSPASHPLSTVDASLGAAAFAVEYDLAALERRARLLAGSMDEAADSLAAHRDLLESTPSILPTAGFLSSRFSYSRNHPIHHQPLPHEGIDVSAPRGTPILSAAKGRVVRAGWTAGYGQMVEIDHGYGFTTRYGHAAKLLVRVGQQVRRGDIVAQVGSTGIATSAHLHYEVRLNGRAQNPMNYVLPGVVP